MAVAAAATEANCKALRCGKRLGAAGCMSCMQHVNLEVRMRARQLSRCCKHNKARSRMPYVFAYDIMPGLMRDATPGLP
eukprot:4871299-Pleurochrysis_carterae.AAC.2